MALRNALSLLLLLCLACNTSTPAGDAPTEEVQWDLKTVHGDGWSLEVPRDWSETSPGLFVGPDRAHVLVSMRSNPRPLSSFVHLNTADLIASHDDYEVIKQRMGRLGPHTAQEILGRFTSPKGAPVTQLTVIVDCGPRKAVLTLGARTPDYRAQSGLFRRIVESFSTSEAASGAGAGAAP